MYEVIITGSGYVLPKDRELWNDADHIEHVLHRDIKTIIDRMKLDMTFKVWVRDMDEGDNARNELLKENKL